LILIGFNPRLELPLLNSYLRKNYLNNLNFKIYSIGFSLDYLTYPVINLGSSIKSLYKFLLGLSLINNYFLYNNYYNHYFFNFKTVLSFYLFVGSSNLIRIDSDFLLNSLFSFFFEFKLPINNLNIINRHLGRLSFSELGLTQGIKLKSKFLKSLNSFNFLVGLDNINFVKKTNINVYQGFFYISNFFENINLILPSSIFSENILSFLNLEGRFRNTNKAVVPFKFIFSDSDVIESLSILLRTLYPHNFSILNNFYNIIYYFRNLINFYINYLYNLRTNILLYENNIYNFHVSLYNLSFASKIINNSLFSKIVYNFYTSDCFSKKSKVLTIMSYKIKFISFYNNNNNLNL